MIPNLPPDSPPGLPDELSDVQASFAEVSQHLDDCESVVNAHVERLKAAAAECLSSCGTVAGDCWACIEGRVQTLLNAADGTASKCGGKIVVRARELIRSAWDQVHPYLGMEHPIEDQIAAFLPPGPAAAAAQVLAQPADRKPLSPLFRPEGGQITDIPKPGQVFPFTPPEGGVGPDIPLTELPRPKPYSCAGDEEGFQQGDGTWDCRPVPKPAAPPPPGTCLIDPNPPPETCPITYCDGRVVTGTKVDGACVPPAVPKPPAPVAPKPPDDGGGDSHYGPIPDWGNVELCHQLHDTLAAWEDPAFDLTRAVPWYLDEGQHKKIVPKWLYDQIGDLPPIVHDVVFWPVYAVLLGVREFGRHAPTGGSCDKRILPIVWAVGACLDLVTKWTGIEFEPARQSLDYLQRYACPAEIPGQGEVDELFHTGRIDETTWECLTKANDHFPSWAKQLREIRERRLSPADYINAVRRELVNQKDFTALLHQHFGIQFDDAQIIWQTSQPMPSLGSIIGYQAGNATDDEAAARFGMDEGWDVKPTDQLWYWLKWQGVTDEQRKLEWRSHWRWPALGELFQMLHRLRPDSPDPDLAALAVSAEDVQLTVDINDMVPYWAERVTALARRPFSRRDAVQAYRYGIIDKTRVVETFRDLGYSKSDAGELADVEELRKDDMTAKAGRVLSVKAAVGMYVKGLLSEQELLAVVQSYSVNDAANQATLSDARLMKAVALRGRLIRVVKRRFDNHEIQAGDAIGILTAAGIDSQTAGQEVETWIKVKGAKGKEIAAATLCKWLGQGIITTDEFGRRLERIGYTSADAARIVASCIDDIMRKGQKGSGPKKPKP